VLGVYASRTLPIGGLEEEAELFGQAHRRGEKGGRLNSTYFGLLGEFGEAHIPLERVAPKYFGLSYEEARRRAPTKMLPCRAFRLGGQKSPWLVSAADLAELIDQRRERAAEPR